VRLILGLVAYGLVEEAGRATPLDRSRRNLLSSFDNDVNTELRFRAAYIARVGIVSGKSGR
jgi:hypothetical protein